MTTALPASARKEFERAVSLFNEGRLATADDICVGLLARFPDDAELAHFGGVLANRMGRFEVAVQRLDRSLAARPQRARALAALAFAHEQLGHLDEARQRFAAAIQAEPTFADAHNGLGMTLRRMGRHAEALASFERAIALDARMAEPRLNAASLLLDSGRVAEAAARYREALSLAKGRNDIVRACAVGLQEAGEIDSAVAAYRALEAHGQLDAAAHHALFIGLMRSGHIGGAWPEYLYRPTRGAAVLGEIAQGRYPPPLPQPIEGAGIVIGWEQGIGDMLFFLRYAKPLADAGAQLRLANVEPRVAGLVRRALPIEIVDTGEAPRGTFVWAGDLPLFTRALTGADVCPSLELAPLADRVDRMRERLGRAELPAIGIAWRAGVPAKSAPSGQQVLFKEIAPRVFGEALAGLPMRFVSVQRHASAESMREMEHALGAPLLDLGDANEDLEDTLALLSLLDGYVGVSSTNVHLRAALGRAGRILVPFPPEWRWQGAGRSPFFNDFETYRQDRDGSWGHALARLRADLSAKREVH